MSETPSASPDATAALAGGKPDEPLNLDEVRLDPAYALKVPAKLARRRQVLPFACLGTCVYVACRDTTDSTAIQAVSRFLNAPVEACQAEPESLRRALDRVYSQPVVRGGGEAAVGRRRSMDRGRSLDLRQGRGGSLDGLPEPEAEAVVQLSDDLLQTAILRQASDVHLDPGEEAMRVRLRVDGQLETLEEIPKERAGGVVSRFKVLAGMDIAEKRAPQDGRFTQPVGQQQRAIDVRVASLPTRHGERLTLRLLALQTASLTLERLGMSPEHLVRFDTAIHKPHGLVLLTGPTGSGKSTTLYAALRRLIEERPLNVVTIEDPIEYEIDGVTQVEVDAADKVSFQKALRSILRHDPDVFMIGEIRDRDTADVAIKAALTGHLVFSTLHTNSAAGVVTRLEDMGVERYLIAATLRLAVAQRLVRRLCPKCAQPTPIAPQHAAALGRSDLAGQTAYTAAGCLYCAGRGYAGRSGLFELMPVDEEISRQIALGAGEAALVSHMHQAGLPRLVDDAADKLTAGVSSVEEAMAAVTVW